MIEKKKMWALTSNLSILDVTAIVEDGKVLAVNKTLKNHPEVFVTRPEFEYFNSRKEAEDGLKCKIEYIKDLVKKTNELLVYIDNAGSYVLSTHGIDIDRCVKKFCIFDEGLKADSEKYHNLSKKLENYIRSRMVVIGSSMFPYDKVKEIDWYAPSENGDFGDWELKARLTMEDGTIYETESDEDVKLVKTLFGSNAGVYFVDDK